MRGSSDLRISEETYCETVEIREVKDVNVESGGIDCSDGSVDESDACGGPDNAPDVVTDGSKGSDEVDEGKGKGNSPEPIAMVMGSTDLTSTTAKALQPEPHRDTGSLCARVNIALTKRLKLRMTEKWKLCMSCVTMKGQALPW